MDHFDSGTAGACMTKGRRETRGHKVPGEGKDVDEGGARDTAIRGGIVGGAGHGGVGRVTRADLLAVGDAEDDAGGKVKGNVAPVLRGIEESSHGFAGFVSLHGPEGSDGGLGEGGLEEAAVEFELRTPAEESEGEAPSHSEM